MPTAASSGFGIPAYAAELIHTFTVLEALQLMAE
jgi:hypothetical protein